MPALTVIKATGESEPFSEEKLRNSIRRAGIPEYLEQQVVNHVKSRLYQNIETKDIYKHITEFLVKTNTPYAKTKYSLKQSLLGLGPTGYPFEDFVAELLNKQGYTTIVRSIMQGKCISHEIDVLAQKDDKRIMVECKFHNGLGVRTDVHVAMYTKARFDDIKERNDVQEVWIVTNTKATTDAITYALCTDVRVVSWNYPEGKGLRDLITKDELHPITELVTLSEIQKQQLLTNHVVLARDIFDNPKLLDHITNLDHIHKNRVLDEVKFICNGR